MQKTYFKKSMLSIILAIVSLISLFLYAKIDSFSIATTEQKAKVELSLSKFVNYNENWGKGVTLQCNLKTGIEHEDGQEQKKIKDTRIEVAEPQINGVYPDKVTVISKSTKFTNGDSDKKLVEYTYSKEIGKINITVKNVDENGNVIKSEISENARDEFEIISNYGDAAYSGENVERKLKVQVNIEQDLFDENNTNENSQALIAENHKEYEVTLKENVGNIISEKQTSDEVYNGYIKSNINNGTDYATQYKEYNELQISNKNVQEKIIVEENTDKAGYKVTKINKDDIKNLLGENGKVEIHDMDGNILGTFNKDNDTIVYKTQPLAIKIRTSTIVNEGILRIENTKELLNKTEMIDNIKTVQQITGIKQEQETYKKQNEKTIEVKNSQTKVEITPNKEEWTNEEQNEIELNVKFDTNSAQCNLLKNPSVSIELPSEVEKVILGESSLIYGGTLKLENVSLDKNENGNFVINANLQGEQNEYTINELGIETTIKIPATVILNKDIEADKARIDATYTNKYEEETGNISKEIKLKKYQKVNTTNEQNNEGTFLKENNEKNEAEQNAQNNEQQSNQTVEQLPVEQPEVTAVVAENPEDNRLQLEVKPTKGETELNNGDVVYEGEFIKYNITLKNTSNEDIENVKLVANIPEGVTYGELEADFYTVEGEYKYNYNAEIRNKEIILEKIEANKSYSGFFEVKANDLNETETEKQIESNVRVYVQNLEVAKYSQANLIKQTQAKVFVEACTTEMRDNWRYRFNVETNEEVELTVKFPEQFEFNSIVRIEIDEETGEYIGLKWSEDKYNINSNILTTNVGQGQYAVFGQIDSTLFNDYKVENNEVELYTYANVTTNNTSYSSNENRIKVKFEEVNISIESENEGEEVEYGEEINYKIIVNNKGGMSKTRPVNVNVKDYLPDNVEYTEVIYENWESEKENFIYDDNGEIISYTTTGRFNKIDKSEKIYHYIDNDNSFYKIDLELCIPYGETCVINVKGKAGEVKEKTKIQNFATVSDSESNPAEIIKTKTSNTIIHYIKPREIEPIIWPINDDDNQDNPITPDNQDDNNQNQNQDNNNYNGNFSINGKAWLDENKNGEYDVGEKLLDGITTILVDMADSANIKSRTTTNQNGVYTFDDLAQGNYIVIFEYDTTKYLITNYKKNGVAEELNSDAQMDTVTINGEKKLVGITDTISVNKNYSNIDIGLINNETTNLKVDKYINKVILTTDKNSTEKEYDNVKLAKTEIKAKQVEGAIVDVVYKIVITNTGEYESSIGSVIDYLPKGFSLNKEYNNNWISNKNEVLNTSLANKQLKANESAELTIVLTKTMTADGTGTFTNIAKLNGQNTVDSNNKADIIISISTGTVIIYILIGVVILLCLFIGIFLVRKYGISKVAKPMLLLIIAIILANPMNIANGETGKTVTEYAQGYTRYVERWQDYVLKKTDQGAQEAPGWNGNRNKIKASKWKLGRTIW